MDSDRWSNGVGKLSIASRQIPENSPCGIELLTWYPAYLMPSLSVFHPWLICISSQTFKS